MAGIRSLPGALAVLVITSGIAVLPALTSAAPASAQASCAGTTTDGSGHVNCMLGVGLARGVGLGPR